MESFWPCSIVPLCDSGDIPMSPLVLSDSSSSFGTGRFDADLASSVRFSPNRSAPGSSGESVPGRGESTAGSRKPGRVWFLDLISLLDGSPWEIPVRRDLLSQAGIYHPRPKLWKLWVWPLRGHN